MTFKVEIALNKDGLSIVCHEFAYSLRIRNNFRCCYNLVRCERKYRITRYSCIIQHINGILIGKKYCIPISSANKRKPSICQTQISISIILCSYNIVEYWRIFLNSIVDSPSIVSGCFGNFLVVRAKTSVYLDIVNVLICIHKAVTNNSFHQVGGMGISYAIFCHNRQANNEHLHKHEHAQQERNRLPFHCFFSFQEK